MEHPLEGCHVLVVDDEPLIAFDLCEQIAEAGGFVVGPAGSVAGAIELISSQELDAAVLDIKLGEEMVFSVAKLLTSMSIPFVFESGYEPDHIPSEFAHVPCCTKPFMLHEIVEALIHLTGGHCHPGVSDTKSLSLAGGVY